MELYYAKLRLIFDGFPADLRPNNINKNAKKRKVKVGFCLFLLYTIFLKILNIQADKWAFEGLKYSAFENAAGQESGCTPYAALPKYKTKQQFVSDHETRLQKCLVRMTGVYKDTFTDAIKRMEKIQKHLISSTSLSISGAALGKF